MIVKAWQELENGSSSSLEALNLAIGRHSPFVAWRLFLNALNCFYSGNPEFARENLVRIGLDSPLSGLACEFAGLLRDRGHADSAVQQQIIRATNGSNLSSSVAELETNLGKNFPIHRQQEILQTVFSEELRKNRPILYYNLGAVLHLMVSHLPHPEDWLKALRILKDQVRMVILVKHAEHMESLEDWLYLSGLDCFSSLEYALIYDWIATIDSLRFHPGNRMHTNLRSNMPKEKAHVIYRELEEYWRKSILHDPLAETYSKWHRMSESFLTPAQSDKILELWHKDFPDDENVLFKLLESARKRKVYTKAVSHLRRLEELAPNHPGLAQTGKLLQLELVLSHLEKGRKTEAQQTALQFDNRSGIFFEAFQNFIKIQCGASGITLIYPLITRYLQTRAVDGKFKLPVCISGDAWDEEPEAEDFFNEFESIFAIRDPVWGNARLTTLRYPKDELKHLERIPSERLWNLCRLFPDQANQFRYGRGILDFLWSLTSAGLSRRDNWTGAFLLLRAFTLLSVCRFIRDRKSYEFLREKMISILAAASKSLRKASNFAPLKNVPEYLNQLHVQQSDFESKTEHMEHHEAQKIIEMEMSSHLDSLVRKGCIPEASSYYEDSTDYPCLLSNYHLLSDDFGSEIDDDFDDDDDFSDLENNLTGLLQTLLEEGKARGIPKEELAQKLLQEMERAKR